MSVEAEMSVIGCMVLDTEACKTAVDGLTEEMFTSARTRRIFKTAVDLYWAGKPTDMVTLLSSVPEEQDTIRRLAEYVPTLRHLREYIQLVADDWRRVSIGRAAGIIMAEADTRTVEESLERLRELVREQELISRARENTGISFTEAARQLIDFLESKRDDTVKSGFTSLDKAMGGFLRKSVTALCARSGGGKTDYAVNLALRMMKRGYRVQYFTMEMTAVQLMQRMASQIVRIDGTRIRDRDLDEEEIRTVKAVTAAMERDGKLNFVEDQHISVRDIRRHIDLFKPDVLFVDHIGLMGRPEIRDQCKALGLVSNALKQLALEKDIAIINLAQMNRQIEGRKDKRPSLSDIRESGEIEQDADYVLFVQPEEMTEKRLCGEAWADSTIFLLKNRHGRTGAFPHHWQPQYHTFTEVETRYG